MPKKDQNEKDYSKYQAWMKEYDKWAAEVIKYLCDTLKVCELPKFEPQKVSLSDPEKEFSLSKLIEKRESECGKLKQELLKRYKNAEMNLIVRCGKTVIFSRKLKAQQPSR